MGVNLNAHTADTPELKSKAEEIAVRNATAIIDVLRGVTEFDRYGQYFWVGDHEKAMDSWNEAFRILKHAKEELKILQKEEYQFIQTQLDSSKVLAGQELGLMQTGTKDSIESTFGEILLEMQSMITLLDHLDKMQYAGQQGLAKGELKVVYDAVSTTSRQLTKVSLNLFNRLLDRSKFTHEASDLASSILPDKVVNVKPLLQEA